MLLIKFKKVYNMNSTITIKKYKDENKVVWDEFVRKSKNPMFMFERNYMDYHKNRFSDNSYMFYYRDKLIALLPACKKGNVLYSHEGLTYGGLILSQDAKQHIVNDCFRELILQCNETGINELIYKAIPHIYHLQPAEEDIYALKINGAKVKEVSASTVINLSNQLKMAKGRKAQISRAKREGIEVREVIDKGEFEEFLYMENEILEKRHGTHAVHSPDELYMLYQNFPYNIKLFGAFKDCQLIAGSVVYVYEKAIHTQYMAANDQAREIGALDLVIDVIIRNYRNTKNWLDFGVSTENGGKYLNEGLISQKEGFGGRTIVYEIWNLRMGVSQTDELGICSI